MAKSKDKGGERDRKSMKKKKPKDQKEPRKP